MASDDSIKHSSDDTTSTNIHVHFPDGEKVDNDGNDSLMTKNNNDHHSNHRKLHSPPLPDPLRLSPVILHHPDDSHGDDSYGGVLLDEQQQLHQDDNKDHVKFIFKPIIVEIESTPKITFEECEGVSHHHAVSSPTKATTSRSRSSSFSADNHHDHDPNLSVHFSDGKKPSDEKNNTTNNNSSHKRIPSPPPSPEVVGRLSPVIYHHEHHLSSEVEEIDNNKNDHVKFSKDTLF